MMGNATPTINCHIQPPNDDNAVHCHSLSIQPAHNYNNNDNPATDSCSDKSSKISSYHDPSSNDLTIFTGAILLTADCMGTGILALPADVQTLGRAWGIGFLLVNLPINLYAGTILGRCALYVEERILGLNDAHAAVAVSKVKMEEDDENGHENNEDGNNGSIVMDHVVDATATDIAAKSQHKRRRKGYSSVDGNYNSSLMSDMYTSHGQVKQQNDDEISESAGGSLQERTAENEWNEEDDHSDVIGNGHGQQQQQHHTDTATFDFVGMTSMLFDEPILPSMAECFVNEAFDPEDEQQQTDPHKTHHHHHHQQRQITYKHPFTKVVLSIYYVNLFLVLGNYILVMSHAVAAMAGESNLCIPTAGIIASTLMFALSQLRTMAHLGRSVSAVSLLALLIVVVQCLYSLRGADKDGGNEIMEQEAEEYATYTTAETVLAKMSSLAAIGFAVGSQKLLLNIRHEMADRTKAAPGALSISLSLYGFAYTVVCLLAGPQPPSFLFDAIPTGPGRRIAGFLLWVHVAVSYAINSQALCSSVDRVMGQRVKICGLDRRHRVRWGILSGMVAISSYLVANAIPFFKDLVALCGATTSIPLTLLIPAIFYRRVQGVPICFPTLHSKYSFALAMFSILFMIAGLIGALGSIDVDWQNKSAPFACQ